MKYYLYSRTAAVVKINGKFRGVTDGNYFAFQADEALLEVTPLDDRFSAVTSLLGGAPESSETMKVYDMRGGYLLIPSFRHALTSEFKLLFRGRKEFSRGTVAVTCYKETGVRLVIETERDMFVETLPFIPTDARFDYLTENGNEYLTAVIIGRRTLVCAYKITDAITPALKRTCDDYSFAPPYLTLVENADDILGHTIISKWKFSDGVVGATLSVRRKRDIYSLNEKLLPYAFFEELLCGGDVTDFLTPKIKPRAGEFKEFFGEFKAVLPPPDFVSPDFVTLLYDDKVEYADVKTAGGLIENVILT